MSDVRTPALELGCGRYVYTLRFRQLSHRSHKSNVKWFLTHALMCIKEYFENASFLCFCNVVHGAWKNSRHYTPSWTVWIICALIKKVNKFWQFSTFSFSTSCFIKEIENIFFSQITHKNQPKLVSLFFCWFKSWRHSLINARRPANHSVRCVI